MALDHFPLKNMASLIFLLDSISLQPLQRITRVLRTKLSYFFSRVFSPFQGFSFSPSLCLFLFLSCPLLRLSLSLCNEKTLNLQPATFERKKIYRYVRPNYNLLQYLYNSPLMVFKIFLRRRVCGQSTCRSQFIRK